jgi:predicted TIM-barrel fold metal-dependent hydrolase
VDHVFGGLSVSINGHARAFLEQLRVSAADKERIAYRNAERLFRL